MISLWEAHWINRTSRLPREEARVKRWSRPSRERGRKRKRTVTSSSSTPRRRSLVRLRGMDPSSSRRLTAVASLSRSLPFLVFHLLFLLRLYRARCSGSDEKRTPPKPIFSACLSSYLLACLPTRWRRASPARTRRDARQGLLAKAHAPPHGSPPSVTDSRYSRLLMMTSRRRRQFIHEYSTMVSQC